MSEEAPSLNNELEKPTNETKKQQEWESLDDEVPFVNHPESTSEFNESEKPSETELKQKLVDEAKTTDEIKEEKAFYISPGEAYEAYGALFKTPIPKEKIVCYENIQEELRKEGKKNSSFIKRATEGKKVLRDIQRAIDTFTAENLEEKGIHIEDGHTRNGAGNHYYLVKENGKTVFFAEYSGKNKGHKTRVYIDGKWREIIKNNNEEWNKKHFPNQKNR